MWQLLPTQRLEDNCQDSLGGVEINKPLLMRALIHAELKHSCLSNTTYRYKDYTIQSFF